MAEKERIIKEYKIPDRPINEIFLSLNGSPEDFAFRGIIEEETEEREDK